MHVPRMTTRRWMIAVAAVGFACGVARLEIRRASFAERAEVWEDRVNDFVVGPGPCLREEYDTPKMIAKLLAYDRAMARKYRAASRRPWFRVPPDPPPPK